MKKQSVIAAILFFLTMQAQAVVISLDGEEADGANFNVFEVINDNINQVSSISYNFIYEAFDPSLGAELIIEIGHLSSDTFLQIGTQDFSCQDFGVSCEADLAWDDAPGIFSASGTILVDSDIISDGSGAWEILIGDSFDDNGIDGQFQTGSFIEIVQSSVLPASSPSVVLLMLLGVALVLMRKSLS